MSTIIWSETSHNIKINDTHTPSPFPFFQLNKGGGALNKVQLG